MIVSPISEPVTVVVNNSSKKRTLVIIAAVSILAILLVAGSMIFRQSNPGNETNKTTPTSMTSNAATPSEIISLTPQITPAPDTASTLENPIKVTTRDGKQYFYYGAPAGQNNANPKKIIISLPGHGSTAENDYNAWLSHIKGGTYALATLNWWDGNGETVTDYYNPGEIVSLTHYFLQQQGYTAKDIVILQGFSRGSANTYAVIANDVLSPDPVFDGVISASGGYQSDFPLNSAILNSPNTATLYQGIYWILACGGKDPNPDRDGCPAMENTKTFLLAHGANVLAILEDPLGAHGAFHAGNAQLPEQAMKLFDQNLQ